MPEPVQRTDPVQRTEPVRRTDPAAAAGRDAATVPAGDDPTVELELKGSTTTSGAFRGRGTLTLFLSDAAKAKIGLDYRSADRILLTVESEGGIRLSADDSLKLSGGLTRDLVNGEIGGEVTARIKLARDLDAQIQQAFGGSGAKTSVSLKLRF